MDLCPHWLLGPFLSLFGREGETERGGEGGGGMEERGGKSNGNRDQNINTLACSLRGW